MEIEALVLEVQAGGDMENCIFLGRERCVHYSFIYYVYHFYIPNRIYKA